MIESDRAVSGAFRVPHQPHTGEPVPAGRVLGCGDGAPSPQLPDFARVRMATSVPPPARDDELRLRRDVLGTGALSNHGVQPRDRFQYLPGATHVPHSYVLPRSTVDGTPDDATATVPCTITKFARMR